MERTRLVAILGCLFTFAGIAHAQSTPTPAPKPVIDPQAMALLDRAEAKLLSINTLSADCSFIMDYPPDWIHNYHREFRNYEEIRLMKPNYSYADVWLEDRAKNGSWKKEANHAITDVSDGMTFWTVEHDAQWYQKESADPHGKNALLEFANCFCGFFGKSESLAARTKDAGVGQLIGMKYLGVQDWQDKPYKVVEWSYYPNERLSADWLKHVPGGRMVYTDDIYIGADEMVHRIFERWNTGDYFETQLENIQIDSPMTKESFAYAPPAGYHLPQPPPPLLADGTLAPDFTVHDAAGNALKLSDYKGKVVVIDFWATWCAPCQEGLPGTNQVAGEFKNKNVVVLAVNVWDTPDAFKSWLPQHKDFDSLVFAIDPTKNNKDVASVLYKVTGIPTQYVVDPSGKIVASFVGYNPSEKPLEDAIQKAAGAS